MMQCICQHRDIHSEFVEQLPQSPSLSPHNSWSESLVWSSLVCNIRRDALHAQGAGASGQQAVQSLHAGDYRPAYGLVIA